MSLSLEVGGAGERRRGVKTRKQCHPRAAQLRDLASIVAAIDAADDPKNEDIATSIVDIELRKLEEETLASEAAQTERHIDKLEGWVKGLEAQE